MFNFFATPLGRLGQGEGFGKWTDLSDPGATLEKILSMVIGFMTIVGSIWFMIQFILGAFNWISSSGEKNKVKEAQDKITNSVVGLIILVAAYALISIIGSLLGIEILNPAKTLNLFTQ